MSILDALVSGLMISSASRPYAHPIDLVLPVAGGALVGRGVWWRLPVDQRLPAIQMVYGRLVEAPGGFVLTDRPDGANVNLLPPETEEEVQSVKVVTDARRLWKEAYLEALRSLQTSLGDTVSMVDWIAKAEALPELSVTTLLEVPEREVCRVILAQGDTPCSLLLFDSAGDWHIVGVYDPWLESVASEWSMGRDIRFPEYISLLKGRMPYGEKGVWRIDTLRVAGPLATLAPNIDHHRV